MHQFFGFAQSGAGCLNFDNFITIVIVTRDGKIPNLTTEAVSETLDQYFPECSQFLVDSGVFESGHVKPKLF